VSIAFTGPLPSEVCTSRFSPTHTFTVASVVNVPLVDSSVITRIDSTEKNSCCQPVARRINNSSDASAASKW